jgi:uncharacterized membrane protein YgcG
MKNHIRILVLAAILISFLFPAQLIAQTKPTAPPKAKPAQLPFREISGIVKDTTDNEVPGATVTLTSDQDTLKMSTNVDGIFIFKNVKSATYTLQVQSIGFTKTPPMRFKQNDAIPRIVMDPIILKEEQNTLNEVVIRGEPSITYKVDTVEYRASDYIVRENATVDELLKKMEGMEVSNDGTLVHQGLAVTRAKVNGKEYQGGDIATAIQNLPAEIVDKIQIVDDYGDQAAMTGVKDGDPEKVLNISTKTSKSVGNMANIHAGGGNNERYQTGLFATRMNGNQTMGLNGRFNNTINGVSGGGNESDNGGGRGGSSGGGRGGSNQGGGQSSGGSGGTTTSGSGGFSYRDKLGQKVEINMNYRFSTNDVNSLNSSESLNPSSLGTTFSVNNSNSDNISKTHNFNAEVEAKLDSNNFLRVVPTLRYSSTSAFSNSSLYQTGLLHQNRESINSSTNKKPQIGISVFYQHLFDNMRRNLSVQAELNSNNQDMEQERDIKIVYFLNEAETQTRDSAINRIVARKNLQDNYRGSMTYVEPLTAISQFELNAQVNHNGYDNSATTRNITPNGNSQIIDSLSNIYDYSFTQGRFALNYRYGVGNTSKVKFSVGLTAVPALLSGTKVSLGTTTNRASFNLIPIARFEYLWSMQHKFAINYSGSAQEPTFDQIQPVRDVSNPQNPVIGNPDLKATFVHAIKADYNNYIANSKLNYSINLVGALTDNSVIRNTLEILDPSVQGTKVYIRETRFLNTNGAYRLSANYSVSKQLNDRKYNLSLSGSARYDHRPSMSNNQTNINTVQTFIERFGPRINPTEWFEINPNVSYNFTKSMNSLPSFIDTKINTLAFNLDGRLYFLKSYLFGYSASKNYVSGISANVSSNPFVINMYLEKEFFKRRGKVTFQAFDLLNQNNFVNREIRENGGYEDTKSNALSRYFMLRLSMRLQKWTGAKGKGGKPVMRRGDGSFM